jgi:TrmH family RNA methyltransferase
LPKKKEYGKVCVVLVSTRNPLNIGAAARAMSNFGFSDLRVVNPYEKAFREAKSAVGGARVLAQAHEYGSVAEAVADCNLVVGTTAVRTRELQHAVRLVEAGARLMKKSPGNVALLFGSEKYGLSNDDMSHCHWLLRIPTSDQNISMNLGQAVAICLYELIRDGRRPTKEKGTQKLASAEEMERITTVLLDVLHGSGFLKRRQVADADVRIRRVVRRLKWPERDATVWTGMLRQILWKLRQGGPPEG